MTSASQDCGTSRVLQAYWCGSSWWGRKHCQARMAAGTASGSFSSSQPMISRSESQSEYTSSP